MKKKILFLFSVLFLMGLCSVLTLPASAATKGTTGDCTWTLDGTVLTVAGSGKMADYSLEGESAPWGTSVTKVVLENGVTHIGDRAFDYCQRLTELSIPDSVKTVGEFAFSSCSSLVSVTLPESVTKIGGYAFYYCNSLTTAVIEGPVIAIGEFTFSDCYKLTSVTLPDTVNYIYNAAFQSCESLTSIALPKNVSYIDENAFYWCSALRDVWYAGSLADREAMIINWDNTPLTSATWHYDFCASNPDTNKVHVYSGLCDYFCDICGVSRTAPHAYDNECDPTCNLCRSSRSTVHRTMVKVPLTGYTTENDVTYPFTKSGEWTVSGNKTKNTFSSYTVTVHHDCALKVDYKVSSEENFDLMTVEKNYVVLDTVSGEVQKSITLSLEKGDTVTFTYMKDNADSVGADCAYFKVTCICPEEQAVPSSTLSPTCTEGVVCVYCETVVKSAAGHSYADDCDADCNACKIVRTPPHVYGNECDFDCNLCGATRTAPDHAYDNACDADCNLCGTNRTPPHAYDNECDPVCNLCGETRAVTHYTKVEVKAISHTLKNDATYPFAQSDGWTVSTNKTKSTASTYTITAQHACTLALDYKVSSEVNYDKMTVKKNSTTLDTVSGEVEKSITLTLAVGDTLTITYKKDNRTDKGSDCAYFRFSCTCTEEKEFPSSTLSPTCTQGVACSRCGTTVKPVADHTYGNACDTDCDVCGQTREITHTYDNACDSACNVCGAVRTVEHSYTNACDSDCNICEATRTPPHVYDNAQDLICNVCGSERPPYTPGDVDGDGDLDMDDAIYLLFAVNFPESYRLNQPANFDGLGETDTDDAIYLLFHVNFEDQYPLH